MQYEQEPIGRGQVVTVNDLFGGGVEVRRRRQNAGNLDERDWAETPEINQDWSDTPEDNLPGTMEIPRDSNNSPDNEHDKRGPVELPDDFWDDVDVRGCRDEISELLN